MSRELATKASAEGGTEQRFIAQFSAALFCVQGGFMGKFDQEVDAGRVAAYRRQANRVIKSTLEQGAEAMDNRIQPALIADYLNVQHERVNYLLRGGSYDAAGAR